MNGASKKTNDTMKIKFLRVPNFGRGISRNPEGSYLLTPPLGISILTSILRDNNFEVDQDDLKVKVLRKLLDEDEPEIHLEIFDDKKRLENFLNNFSDQELEEEAGKILNMTDLENFDIIGLSAYPGKGISGLCVTSVLSKLLKEKYDKTVIVGGQLKDKNLRGLLRSGYIDYAVKHHDVILPAEFIFLEFCELMRECRNSSIKNKNIKNHLDIPGVMYEKNGKIKMKKSERRFTEERPIVRPDFDGLPLDLYRWELKCDIKGEEYSSNILVLPYRFVIGCPFYCAFCKESISKGWFTKDVDDVIEDLKYFSQKYDTEYFFFLNPEVNPTYDYAEGFAEKLIDSDIDIKWTDSANLANLDEKLVNKLEKAGMRCVTVGFENASNKILEYIDKPVRRDEAEKKLENFEDHDIMVSLNLISGFPWEREEDVQETINFIEENSKYIDISELNRFFLDGKISRKPQEYNLKKLRDSIKKGDICSERGEGYNFKEIGNSSLSPKEKEEQAERATEKIRNTLKENNIRPSIDIHSTFLFSLFSGKIDSKRKRWRREGGKIYYQPLEKIRFFGEGGESYVFKKGEKFRAVLKGNEGTFRLRFKEMTKEDGEVKFRTSIYLNPSETKGEKTVFETDSLFLDAHPYVVDVIDSEGDVVISKIPMKVEDEGEKEVPEKSVFVEKDNKRSSFPGGDFILLNSKESEIMESGTCVIVDRTVFWDAGEGYLFRRGEFEKKVEGKDVWSLVDEVE